ncbi:MAG: hypothetical protein JXQ29_18210, partial [Planctomycetes bacterium]|nr:hypothetical protein [Planctomycetota bacterium]
AEIRDQIARTTIEQSFVNATPATLEGVFYFPLPADASISGFGMWIGGELVEADIVEKEKARRIYEEILRQKKDPGLLEWSGGNLFKARVYPIFPHAEKRIRIRYTQFLPLEGATLRYRYALRSELLRSRPLRELRLDVIVSSALPIREVRSATHEVRIRRTDHAASAEFVAAEFSPDRDFELAVELDRSQPLSFVPHRRAEDGYFMLAFAAPAEGEGTWQRDLVPEAGALDVLIVADTSGSMDPAAREAQAAFLGALLGQLGREDRFRLMGADVQVRWFVEQATAVTEEAVQAALEALEARRSLGWSDLDLALREALGRAGPGTHVIYVGDGIGTTDDADPVALSKRLRELGKPSGVIAHAVSVSSTFEKGVLEAIAGIGGGSVRGVGDDPAGAAFALLKEIARPPLRDLQVSFEGLRTARVYPAVLPNLPAGAQQTILGRFLPAAGRQTGKVVVSGTRDGKPVRFTADVVLDEKEAGNDFVPRLWARRHIDALLEEGRSHAAREEVVRFSEEFGIMTPFTSFLVLESDADRERYGVERRVKMRDGERFFAEGRDAASTALLREQMKLARTWRQELRKQMLREIATLGEELVPATVAVGVEEVRGIATWGDNESGAYYFGRKSGREEAKLGKPASAAAPPAAHRGDKLDREEGEEPLEAGEALDAEEELDDEEALDKGEVAESKKSLEKLEAAEPMARARRSLREAEPAQGYISRDAYSDFRRLRSASEKMVDQAGKLVTFHEVARFPYLPDAPQPTAEPAELPKWPAEVLELVKSLDRRARLAARATGLELAQTGGPVHGLTGRSTDIERTRGLYGKAGWFLEEGGRGREPAQQWVFGGERGALAAGARLGRKRPAEPTDAADWQFPLRDDSMGELWREYMDHAAKIVGTDGEVVTVELTAPAPGRTAVRLVIDRKRCVLLEKTALEYGQVAAQTRYADFVELGDQWWATSIEELDRKGLPVARYRLAVKALDAESFSGALAAAVSGQEDAIFLGKSAPDLEAAKQAVFERQAGFAEHYGIAQHFADSDQWDRAWEAWTAAEEAVKGKPGAPWLRATLLAQSRKGEELKAHLLQLVTGIAGTSGPATDALALKGIELSGTVLHPTERLAVLEALRPAFLRQAEDREWRETLYDRLRAELLASLARRAEALAIYAKIAAARPDELRAVRDYVGALETTGRHEAAVEMLEAKLRLEKTWLESERDELYLRLTSLLWARRDVKKLAAHLEKWVAAAPEVDDAYTRFLSVLLIRDELEAADAWVAARLGEAIPSPTTPVFRARLGAAISVSLGRGWTFSTNRIEEKWLDPLADLARRLLKVDDKVWPLADRILSDRRFRHTDAYAQLQKALVADLEAEGTIETAELARLARILDFLPWGRDNVDPAVWRRTVDRLKKRLANTADRYERDVLASCVLQLLDKHGEKDEAADFLRARLAAADERTRPAATGQLLERLFSFAWSPELENEILALVGKLEPTGAAPMQRRATAAAAVRKVVAALVAMRNRHELGEAKDREKLPRAELRKREIDARRAALAGLAARLATARDEVKWAAEWFELERVGLRARLGKLGADLKTTDGEAREIFFATPADSMDAMDSIRRERCACVLAYCATRRNAPEGLADEVVKLFTELERTAPLASGKDKDKAEAAGPKPRPIDWRYHLYRLLIALDRPQALAQVLESWIVPAKVESRWRIALGYLLAETGKLEPAIAAFEAVAAADELKAEDYEALANWQLVVGNDRQREAALLARHRVSPEHVLSNRLYAAIRQVSRRGGGVPEELDPDALRVLRALLTKAGHPARYLWQVQQLYGAVKDFRVLECLAEGVTGHSAAAVYPFLEQVGRVINQVHEEATCDTLAARIRERSAEVTTDLDRRGLLLLTALVERRAADVLNAPGPHAERGLEALRAACKGEWLPGERQLMADFLASLGRIRQPAFAAEQMRQLRDLYRAEAAGSAEQLAVGRLLFQTEWAHERFDAAIDGLSATLAEYRKAQGGVLPDPARDGVELLVGWLENRKRFSPAESCLETELATELLPAYRDWCRERLFRVWVTALNGEGAVSFGTGEALYREARKRIEASIWKDSPERLPSTVSIFCALHRAAERKAGVRAAGDDLVRFSNEKLPELLTLAHTDASRLVGAVAGELVELRGPPAGIRLVLDSLDREPRWFARAGQGGWRAYGSMLARWRSEARELGELEPRLLRVVLAELERDLRSLESWNRSIYWHGNRYFWASKRDEFAAVASRVIELEPDSSARLLYAANYLWDGLGLRDRAIGVLLGAEGRGVLREDSRHQLVVWLHEERRYQESLPILEALRAARADHFGYRTLAVSALHETAQDEAARALLDETVQRLKKLEQWHESALAELAGTARQCGFHDRAIALYEELIPLHQRTHRNRGIGSGTLSSYYGWLAEAYVATGKSDQAVDAASAAVVAWGPSSENRNRALRALRRVLERIGDLEAWVAGYERKAAESGLDAPVIRKLLGLVYLDRHNTKEAIRQLTIARELEPEDDAIHEALVKAFDAADDAQGAAEALFASIRMAPMNLALYRELARRLGDRGDADGAERAWTTLVEMKPNEADSHRQLAVRRASQKRFADAVVQWRQVVRCRAEEPDGWFGLARAQLKAGDREGARAAVDHLLSTKWEARFGDVRAAAARLLAEIEAK